MIYQVRHETEFNYSHPVTIGHSALHLRPREVTHQHTTSMQLDIVPRPAITRDRLDYFGNPVTFFSVQHAHKSMTISAESTVEVHRVEPLIEGVSRPWEALRDELATDTSGEGLDAYQYTFDSPSAAGAAELAEYALKSFTPRRPIFDAARDLTGRIHRDFKFDPTTTNVTTPVSEVFAQRSGVCQDFAHLMIACLRSLALPARYVSGYLRTEPPPGQPRLVGADASHAWISVYSHELGWADFDPTGDRLVGPDHITVAWGRDYNDVAPVKGLVLGGGEHWLNVRVDVIPATEMQTKQTQTQSQG